MPDVATKFVLCVLTAVALFGCAGGGVSDIAADQCRSLGFRPGTGIFGDCMDQKKAEIRAGLGDRMRPIERVSN